ncbi:MAG: SDR family oxidoreductase [Acidimicrobiia bacterium]|nr:SDR family oxidoreductase [Acidimicrobiia bacterium]
MGARTGGVSQSAVYNATKAAIVSLTKNFARNYGPAGVTVNAVLPGFTDSFMTSHVTAEERSLWMSQIPIGRAAQPHEIGDVVAFLASDAAGYMTGASVDVNGGWVMT